MNLDRGMYRIAKDLRADDRRRAAQDHRASMARDIDTASDAMAPLPRRPIFASLRRRTGLTGWLRA